MTNGRGRMVRRDVGGKREGGGGEGGGEGGGGEGGREGGRGV